MENGTGQFTAIRNRSGVGPPRCRALASSGRRRRSAGDRASERCGEGRHRARVEPNSPTAAEARQRALAGCRDVKNSTDAARSLCKILGTFHDQCVAGAEDPDAGTPGVGWAVAADKKTAEQQALAMCQAKSPPARRAACKVMTSGCDGSAK